MALIMASTKQGFIETLQERLVALVQTKDREAIRLFCRYFYGIASLEELSARQDNDLLGCTLSSWRALQHFELKSACLGTRTRVGDNPGDIRFVEPF